MNPLEGKSVLLLEDEFLIAMDAEEILKDRLGAATVKIVGTFDAAKAAAETGLFDIALLDVNINGQMSFPIAELLRVRGVPVVFATGYHLGDRRPPEVDPAHCLTKPYTASGLEAAVKSALKAG
jgi:DNA-binding LytR/AlgR family response regulator